MMEIPKQLMVSVSGVRGRVGDGLTPEIVAAFAAAFGAWARDRAPGAARRVQVVVGRDSRVSGAMFHRVVLSALESVGVHVLDVGLSPTPTIQLAVESHSAAGGLAITASHNPVEWNALKFIAPTGLFLNATEAQEMLAYLGRDYPRAAWDALGETREEGGAIEDHIDRILRLGVVDVEAIRARRVRVALDSCRGVGSLIMIPLLERLGCTVAGINLEPDGRFPRSPEPIAANLGELESLVTRSQSEVGFAVDPDADRLALVSEQGRAVGEDFTLALAARVVLGVRPGVVVTNLSTSRVLDDVAASLGSRVVRSPVGEVNVATRMREEGSAIGGEGNGGVILSELHLGRDAPLAAALILQLLAQEGRGLSGIVSDYPSYVIVKDKMERPAGDLTRVWEELAAAFPDADVDRQDGIRFAWDDRWVHVRPSGTEPIVRVIAEARDAAVAEGLVAACRVPLEAMGRG